MLTLLRGVGGALSVYMLLLFIRILLTWFSGPTEGAPVRLLNRVTDPYLNVFRRMAFLRASHIDFSPIVAIVTLVVVLNVVNTLASYGTITVGIVLALTLSAVWSAAFFILGFFIILVVVRLVSVLIGASSINPIWHTLDVIINPVLGVIQKRVFRGRIMTYRIGLAWCGGVLLGAAIVGRILAAFLIGFLARLPF